MGLDVTEDPRGNPMQRHVDGIVTIGGRHIRKSKLVMTGLPRLEYMWPEAWNMMPRSKQKAELEVYMYRKWLEEQFVFVQKIRKQLSRGVQESNKLRSLFSVTQDSDEASPLF